MFDEMTEERVDAMVDEAVYNGFQSPINEEHQWKYSGNYGRGSRLMDVFENGELISNSTTIIDLRTLVDFDTNSKLFFDHDGYWEPVSIEVVKSFVVEDVEAKNWLLKNMNPDESEIHPNRFHG